MVLLIAALGLARSSTAEEEPRRPTALLCHSWSGSAEVEQGAVRVDFVEASRGRVGLGIGVVTGSDGSSTTFLGSTAEPGFVSVTSLSGAGTWSGPLALWSDGRCERVEARDSPRAVPLTASAPWLLGFLPEGCGDLLGCLLDEGQNGTAVHRHVAELQGEIAELCPSTAEASAATEAQWSTASGGDRMPQSLQLIWDAVGDRHSTATDRLRAIERLGGGDDAVRRLEVVGAGQ